MARLATIAAMGISCFGCSFDWDGFDPRISSAASGGNVGAASGGNGAAAPVSASSGSGTGAGGAMTSAGTGGAPVQTVVYTATIAECIDPTAAMPDPDACEAATAPNNFKVDLADAVTGEPSYGYLRFDLDGTLSGRQVLSATLRLTTTGDRHAAGLSTGELWEVAPFTAPDLYVGAPQKIGSTSLAPDQGPAGMHAEVDYPVPTDLVAPDAGVFLALIPISDDGVNYWNTDGTAPPLLVVDYR